MTGAATGESGQVLLVDSDSTARAETADVLGRHGFTVHVAADVNSAGALLAEMEPDIVILGMDGPDTETLALCRRVVDAGDARLIIVSGAADETDRVVGLELGADDYLARPCSPRELVARVRAIRRRQTAQEPVPARPIYAFDVFLLDTGRRELSVQGGAAVALPASAMDVLCALVDHPKRILSRQELVAAAGLDRALDGRAVDMRVSRVRQILRRLAARDPIRNLRGSGYVLDAEVTLWRGPTPPLP